MADLSEGDQKAREDGPGETDCRDCQVPLELTSAGARCLNCGAYYYGETIFDFLQQATEIRDRKYSELQDAMQLVRQPLNQAHKLLEGMLPERRGRMTLNEEISADNGKIRYTLSLVVKQSGMRYELLDICIGINPRMDYNEFPLEFSVDDKPISCKDVHDFEVFILENLKWIVPMIHLLTGFL